MDELTPPAEDRASSTAHVTGVGAETRAGSGGGEDDARGDLGFARVLGAMGAVILLLAALLLALPSFLQGGAGLFLIAYGIAALFGPVGFWLLGEAWRIRNRAVHGTVLPPAHRRNLRILGIALLLVGAFVAFSGFGASGTISTALNLIWGLSLAGYGVRSLLRSFSTEHA